MNTKELEIFAAEIRLNTVKMIGKRGFGHLSGSLSVADVLAVLYGSVMNVMPDNPSWPLRDKLVLSKGHAGPALYAALALKGFFPMEWLDTLNQPKTKLPSHADRRLTPGVDMTTGSLGQGASLAAGLALAQKMDDLNSRTFLILGDGECNEGQVWEMALFAAQHKLGNLIAFVDNNKKQLDGTTSEVMEMGDIAKKFASFGWKALGLDGGCVRQIKEAILGISLTGRAHVPTCIVLNTVKGAGVPSVEAIEYNHHMVVDGDILATAIREATETLKNLGGDV
ncbi:MAG: transketolase [Defluviitaleaceae bacterium]|nr:transketolase [Defluviitaleaceae bacterium]